MNNDYTAAEYSAALDDLKSMDLMGWTYPFKDVIASALLKSAYPILEDKWFPVDKISDNELRPSRQFIRVEGWKEHSGASFSRSYCGDAYVSLNHHLGYREEDLKKIMKDGDLDGIDKVTHWTFIPTAPKGY